MYEGRRLKEGFINTFNTKFDEVIETLKNSLQSGVDKCVRKIIQLYEESAVNMYVYTGATFQRRLCQPEWWDSQCETVKS